MPRVPRLEVEGASYLVMCQGTSNAPLFTTLADYEAYLQLVAHYKQRYGFKLFAYCLMPQEVWLYVEPVPGTSLSSIMHDITTGYTRYANKRYSRTGHLFQDRFKEITVETHEALVKVTAYLHRLPVQRGLAQTIDVYPFSSYPLYRLGETVPDLLHMAPDIREVLHALPTEPGTPAASFGEAKRAGVGDESAEERSSRPAEPTAEAYAAAVEQFSLESLAELEEQMTHHVVGSPEFVERARRRLARASVPVEAALVRAVSEPLPRPKPIRLGVAVGTALVAMFAWITLSLSHRVDGLTQMLMSLAQENEAIFRSHAAVQDGTLQRIASLDGTAWDIRIAPLTALASGPIDEVQQDQLVFLGNKVSSEFLAAHGMPSAPYRLTKLADGSIVWETISADSTGALLTWQGQWQGTTMRGTLSWQLPSGSVRQFTFVGVASTAGDAEPRSEI